MVVNGAELVTKSAASLLAAGLGSSIELLASGIFILVSASLLLGLLGIALTLDLGLQGRNGLRLWSQVLRLPGEVSDADWPFHQRLR